MRPKLLVKLVAVLCLATVLLGAVQITYDGIELNPIVVTPKTAGVEIHADCGICDPEGQLTWETDPLGYLVNLPGDPKYGLRLHNHHIYVHGASNLKQGNAPVEATCTKHGDKEVFYQVTQVAPTLEWSTDGESYTAVNGTLSVKQGNALHFKALPDVTGNSWPTEEPSWSGSSGIAANMGQHTVSHTFSTKSTTLGDKTVIAKVTNQQGDDPTANVTVWLLSQDLSYKACGMSEYGGYGNPIVLVDTGSTVDFKALTDPAGASFGDDEPSWVAGAGVAVDPSYGETTTATFSTLSTSDADTKTVKATLDDVDTEEAEVLVIDDFVLRWRGSEQSEWSDTEIPIVKGTRLEFRCSTPLGGYDYGLIPAWGGTANPPPAGSSNVEVTFNTASTSDTDFKTVTATIDCVIKTLSFLVLDVSLEAVALGNSPELDYGTMCTNAQATYKKARWQASISPSTAGGEYIEAHVWVKSGDPAQYNGDVINNEYFDVTATENTGTYHLRIAPKGYDQTHREFEGEAFAFEVNLGTTEGNLTTTIRKEYPFTQETGAHKKTGDQRLWTQPVSLKTVPSGKYTGNVTASIKATATYSGSLEIQRRDGADMVDLGTFVWQVLGFPDLNVTSLFSACANLRVTVRVDQTETPDERTINSFCLFQTLVCATFTNKEVAHTGEGLNFNLASGTSKDVKVYRQVGISAAYNAIGARSESEVQGATLVIRGESYEIKQ